MSTTPEVLCEATTQESIVYKRGNVCQKLEGFHAALYQQMIWQKGKARATEDFWWLWHKKEGSE